jgi:hypothetical protein
VFRQILGVKNVYGALNVHENTVLKPGFDVALGSMCGGHGLLFAVAYMGQKPILATIHFLKRPGDRFRIVVRQIVGKP